MKGSELSKVYILSRSAWLLILLLIFTLPDHCTSLRRILHSFKRHARVPRFSTLNAINESPHPLIIDDKGDNNNNVDISADRIPRPEVVEPKARGGAAEKMLIVYTCKVCNTRNTQEISKVAYKEGIVVSKCSNCKSSHLIADNTGKLDMAEYGKKIDRYLESKGESVQRLVLTPEQLDENYLIDRNGKLELHNKSGGQPQVDSRIIDWMYKKREQRQQQRKSDGDEGESDSSSQADSEGPALLP